jgi:competence protein ComEA
MKRILSDNAKKIAGAALIIAIAVAAYLYSETLTDDAADYSFAATDTATEESSPSPEPTPLDRKAHIAGEVQNPGVYDIGENTRLQDLIDMAGGLTDKADMSSVNLALKIEDQQKINIPALNEPPSGEPTASIVEGPKSSQSAVVNINTANISELMALPGVGEVTAQKIIDYREANGPFETADDLLLVNGIGEATLEKMRDMVSVR